MAENTNNTYNNQNNQGRMVGGSVYGGFVNQGDNNRISIHNHQPSPPTPEEMLERLKCPLSLIYSKSYRSVIPVSSEDFSFDIKEKWVNLTLKLEGDSIATVDYADLLTKAFAKADMVIMEGDPGVGKSSFMHRLAYEWTQSRSSDYDLVIYVEFRKSRDYEFKDIKELITHYMKDYLSKEEYEIFHQFINDTKWCMEHKILVLLDGYDESCLEKQCEELSEYFNSTISRPLPFSVLLTSRKGYLSKRRNQRRFTFADIIGFTTESQKEEYISKHFNVENVTESSENTAAVKHLLTTNTNLKRLSEIPLMLTFICLTYKNIIDGTEFELYTNIIRWMIDRYQKNNPKQDIPGFFEFKYVPSDKYRVIENNYQHFPQLHKLGTMAMQDIFKTTFTEADLNDFQLKEIVQEVGFLRKEITRDTSNDTKAEYSFLHRTIQEFIVALTFFFSDKKPPKDFRWYVFFTATNKGYGIIPAKIQKFLEMINSSAKKIHKSKKKLYSKYIQFYTEIHSNSSPQPEDSCKYPIHSRADTIDLIINKQISLPKSSEEAIQLLHDEAEKGDIFAQFILGVTYELGVITEQSDEEAVKWYTKSAELGNKGAQCNLGNMYRNGKGVPPSDEEAVKWFRKSAEQEYAKAEYYLGFMYEGGRGVPKSNKEAIEWYTKSAEKGNADAQFYLGYMYMFGKGVPRSHEKAVKWSEKATEQGNAAARSSQQGRTFIRVLNLRRFFFIYCVATLIVSSIWMAAFILLRLPKDIYEQLEWFNKNSTVAVDQEVNLNYLKQLDDIGSYAISCSVIQIVVSGLECGLFAIRVIMDSSGIGGIKKRLSISVYTVFLITVIIQLSATLTMMIYIFDWVERSESENEIFLLFSSFARSNPAGFKVIEDYFYCQGYELTTNDKESSSDDNCTKVLRNQISQTKIFALVIIIGAVVTQCIQIVVILCYIRLIYNFRKHSTKLESPNTFENRKDQDLQRYNANETDKAEPCGDDRIYNGSNSQQNSIEVDIALQQMSNDTG